MIHGLMDSSPEGLSELGGKNISGRDLDAEITEGGREEFLDKVYRTRCDEWFLVSKLNKSSVVSFDLRMSNGSNTICCQKSSIDEQTQGLPLELNSSPSLPGLNSPQCNANL